MTRDIWSNCKKKSTSLGGNIQLCVKSGVVDNNTKVGVLATDDEAYKCFGELLAPIVKELHPHFDHRITYKFDELKQNIVTEHLQELDINI